MRGADPLQYDNAQAHCGSSTRAWGRPHLVRFLQILGRFIPTCVGQTGAAPGGVVAHPVHPHMRGADFGEDGRPMFYCGSSPHAWGRHQRHQTCTGEATVHPHMRGADGHPVRHRAGRSRFIPTCVGQTSRPMDRSAYMHGSSPHVWGRHLVFMRIQRVFIS